MTDGFFSRPSLAEVGLRSLSPSAPRIDGSLARIGVQRLEAVMPVHTHFDHAMDTALVAERTGAKLSAARRRDRWAAGTGCPTTASWWSHLASR